MTSPTGARSSALAHPVLDHPGPFLRLDHSSDQAQRAADGLAGRWEKFERARRWRFFLLVPVLLLAALAAGLLDVVMGFHVRLATWYVPILLVAALLARSATRPAGRGGRSVRLPHWWTPPVWRKPLASCRKMLAAWADPSDQVRGWIDLTGSPQPSKLVAGWPKHGATLHRDVWCRLSIETRRLNRGLRAVEDRLVLPGGRVRRRWRADVVAVAREPYGRPPAAPPPHPRCRRTAADPGGTCAPPPPLPPAEDPAPRPGLARPGRDPARGRRFGAARMTRLGPFPSDESAGNEKRPRCDGASLRFGRTVRAWPDLRRRRPPARSSSRR